MAKKTIADIDRFGTLYSVNENGCWVWSLALDRDGYALFSIGSVTNGTAKRVRAARYAYSQYVGPIGPGLHVDHLCRNRACVNPFHLEAVTPGENVRRSSSSTKTACKRGHDLDGENTYRNPTTGARSCRICRGMLMLNYREKIGRDAVNKYQREWERAKRRRQSA